MLVLLCRQQYHLRHSTTVKLTKYITNNEKELSTLNSQIAVKCCTPKRPEANSVDFPKQHVIINENKTKQNKTTGFLDANKTHL